MHSNRKGIYTLQNSRVYYLECLMSIRINYDGTMSFLLALLLAISCVNSVVRITSVIHHAFLVSKFKEVISGWPLYAVMQLHYFRNAYYFFHIRLLCKSNLNIMEAGRTLTYVVVSRTLHAPPQNANTSPSTCYQQIVQNICKLVMNHV